MKELGFRQKQKPTTTVYGDYQGSLSVAVNPTVSINARKHFSSEDVFFIMFVEQIQNKTIKNRILPKQPKWTG